MSWRKRISPDSNWLELSETALENSPSRAWYRTIARRHQSQAIPATAHAATDTRIAMDSIMGASPDLGLVGHRSEN